MKQFVTEESFWELFPEAQIGIVVAHNMKPTAEVAPADAAAIARALAEANGKADQHLESNTISQNEVVAVWREAYQKFKTKKGARCSIENLLKRVLKGNPVGSITPSVDIYNTVSLTHALPVGGEDIDAMDGAGLLERFAVRHDAAEAMHADLKEELCGFYFVIKYIADERFFGYCHFFISFLILRFSLLFLYLSSRAQLLFVYLHREISVFLRYRHIRALCGRYRLFRFRRCIRVLQ